MLPGLRKRWHRFEDEHNAYRIVTAMLLVLIIVPIALPPGRAALSTITAVLAGGAATLALAASHANIWGVRLALLAWGLTSMTFVLPGEQRAVVSAAFVVLGLLLIATPAVILRRIAQHKTVTAETMWGAVAAYLALGIAFSFVYEAINGFDTTAFSGVVDGVIGEFSYFSFVTMTTLGYGDIIPLADLPRALVVFQTLIGQIYLVVVVARVVSLLGSGQSPRPDDAP